MRTARETAFSGEFAEVKEFYVELRALLYKRASQRFPSFYATPITQADCQIADAPGRRKTPKGVMIGFGRWNTQRIKSSSNAST